MDHVAPDWTTEARPRTRLLTLTVAALMLALGLGAAYTVVELGKRDAIVARAERTTAHLSEANELLRGQVRDLIVQRDNASVQRDLQAAERHAATWLHEQQAAQVDGLRQQALALRQQALELERRLEETTRQLNQAREESARQQTRALSAETIGQTLVEVIQLDNAIAREVQVYHRHVGEMRQAQSQRDDATFAAAARQADQSISRLDALFGERDAALAKLR